MTKTYKNLYTKITDFENLYWSWRKARRGKRYKPAASAFEQNLDEELIQLHHELDMQTWQPGGYRSFTVHEPKRRKISAAPFRDRVVHHALISVIEPIYLMLRLREVEQHLSPAEHQQLGAVLTNRPLLETTQKTNQDISILIEYGLLDGTETLAQIEPPPPTTLPTADDYFFRVGPTLVKSGFKSDYTSLDFVALLASQPRRVEILPGHYYYSSCK
jgi:hypothetical protein